MLEKGALLASSLEGIKKRGGAGRKERGTTHRVRP